MYIQAAAIIHLRIIYKSKLKILVF